MAIHDYVIDNQSAPSFRSDLNSALQAIVTQNSNGTAPTTTYANMIWYDTTANQLKKRNEANSAWITLGTIDEAASKFTPNSAITVSEIAPATLVTSSETIASNNNDTTIPTSAAVKAYTDAAVAGVSVDGTVLIGTINTTSGTSQTLSGLNLTPYSFLYLVLDNVSTNTGGSVLNLGVNGQRLAGDIFSSGNSWSGIAQIDLLTGIYTSLSGYRSAASWTSSTYTFTGDTGFSTATTSITLSIGVGGSFDAGAVRVYGVI